MAGCLALFAAGCVSVQKFDQASSQFPQLSPGQGRIYFYRDSKFYGSGQEETVSLNDEKVGYLKVGRFFYVDRPAGNYTVGGGCAGLLGGLYGKNEVSIALGDGEAKYIRINQNFGLAHVQAVPTPEDKESALKTLADCRYAPEGKHSFF